jgi:uncharacterized protein YuzE
MKIEHDPISGHFTIVLNGQKSVSNKRINSNCILDLDENGEVIAIEILHPDKRGIDPLNVQFVDISDPAYLAELHAKRAAKQEETSS